MNIIPIQPNTPAQSFRITLDGVSYNMDAKWNTRAEFWTLDIADENNTDIVNGIALKAGVDLLSPFNFNIGGLYVILTTTAKDKPSLDNINSGAFLLHLTEAENAELQ